MTKTAIINARIFDGERVLDSTTVVIEGASILAIGKHIPSSAQIVDAGGGTLLPGLIDSHVPTSLEALELALTFGVTTELEMQGMFTRNKRDQITNNDRLADVRSAGFGITPPDGHPRELIGRRQRR